jgi:hypothetical protein
MSTPVSSGVVHAVADTVYMVTRDTLAVNHTDTVAVPYIVYHEPSAWWNIAQLVFPLVFVSLGWKVVHDLNRRAQLEHALNEIVRATAQDVNEGIAEYERWLTMRAALFEHLYRNGAYNRAVAAQLRDQLVQPEAHQWLVRMEGSQYVLGEIVEDVVPISKAFAKRHSDISDLLDKATDQDTGSGVERAAIANTARAQARDLVSDVHNFRLEMLRRVYEKFKPSGRRKWSWLI